MIEVSLDMILLLVGLAFVAGLTLGWGAFEVMQIKRLLAESRRRQEAIRTADELPVIPIPDAPKRPRVLDKTKAMAIKPKWNRGDEDWLLETGIDVTRVASTEDRQV